MQRECARYCLNPETVAAAVQGEVTPGTASLRRHWWEALIVCAAIAVFVWLALSATRQAISVSAPWMCLLGLASLLLLVQCGLVLWRRTRFG